MDEIAQIAAKRWDFVVVGTGMGGATIGHALAKAGKSVLFLEKGITADKTMQGQYAETHFDTVSAPKPEHRPILSKMGRYVDTIRDISGKKPRDFIPFIGSGPGGSTPLYGMALERFAPDIFFPKRQHPDAVGSSLPKAWPIRYEELEPYYAQAEQLYRVKGDCCPLKETNDSGIEPRSDAVGAAMQALMNHLVIKGLHPYRIPLASDSPADCQQCQSYLCTRICKNDSRNICLEPALTQHAAQMIDGCEVLRVDEKDGTVTGLACLKDGTQFTVHGDTVILACGALETPRLLLSSASDAWPNGLANHSGMVGKNLMRHLIDLILVKPRQWDGFRTNSKDFAVNDLFYEEPRLGMMHSFGSLPPPKVMVALLYDDVAHSPFKPLLPLLKLCQPFLLGLMGHWRKRRWVLATIMEDMPYVENAVMLPADGASHVRLDMRYRVSDYDAKRSAQFRRRVKEILHPFNIKILKQTTNNQLVSHAGGTCRFGDDPATSVLDRHNKAHGLTNLYVVDSSFFPSSGGTNPSLTIAANALRVADVILGRANPS